LAKGIDSEILFDNAIKAGISIAPGLIFAPCRRYRNFIRLSFGHPWTPQIEQAIAWLGAEVQNLTEAELSRDPVKFDSQGAMNRP